jgi:pimeloyl-ACP methyl ester carboxylesterase
MKALVIGIGTAIVTVLASGCTRSDPATASGRATAPAAVSRCSASSWIAGTTELCGGHLVYRDYVYDDYGADDNRRTTPVRAGTLSRSAGDQAYPADALNTADLVRLELWLEGGEVVVEFELNTLYTPDQTRAVLAIDSDALAAPLPDSPATSLTMPNWDVVQVFEQGDPDANVIRGRFARPPGSRWTLWAYTEAVTGASTNTFNVMNVAFRGTQEIPGARTSPDGVTPANGNFWEDRQAAALRARDINAFSATVAVADLENGVTRGAEIPPGLHQGVYTSAYTLNDGEGPTKQGEGVSADGVPGRHGDTDSLCEQYFHYLGRYQPYGIYLPAGEGPHGLQLAMHGCAANHSSLINQPGMQDQFGEQLNRIIVVPLGRGPVGWYSDISERDVLDVIADVIANHDINTEEIIAGGYSMGGYGTLRFAAFYPDVFAAATNWVGFTGNVYNNPATEEPPRSSPAGGIGNVIDFVQNLRHIPIVNIYAAEDELVQVNTGLALRQRFLEDTEVVHDFYMHPNAEHLTFAVLDNWVREMEYSRGRRLVKDPARVTYRTDSALDYPEYGIRHDGAYWVSGIVGRAVDDVLDEPADYVDVDVTSFGCGQPQPVFETGEENGAGPAPLTWNRQFRIVTGETPAPAQNRIEAALRNVASLTVDVTRACLGPGAIAYKVETDGPVQIRFSDGRTLSFDAAGMHEG